MIRSRSVSKRIDFLRLDGQHQDVGDFGQSGMANLGADFESVHVGEPQIEDD